MTTSSDPAPISCPHCLCAIPMRSLVGGLCPTCGVELDADDVEVALDGVR